jgi:hypothetical protein
MNPLAFYLLILPMAAHADLFKCTDGIGKVTYTNSACAKVGLKESKVIPPPPPPAVDKVAKATETAKPAAEKNVSATKAKDTVALQMVKTSAANDKCAKLNAEMGRIMDEMDAARNQGPEAGAVSSGNENLKKLQAEKNRLACF